MRLKKKLVDLHGLNLYWEDFYFQLITPVTKHPYFFITLFSNFYKLKICNSYGTMIIY